MTNILAITNQKGGVGKTTTSVNTAAALAAAKQRVLVIDLDPQGNATVGSGIAKHDLALTTTEVLLEKRTMEEAMLNTEQAGFTLLPGNDSLTVAEVELTRAIAREFRLRQALQTVSERFDYVLIDCPPALNNLTINALVACHGVMIPTQCEYYALEGLSALMNTIERVRQRANPRLEVAGVLRTMFDSRNNLAGDVSSQLIEHFGERVYRTIIPRNVTLAEAPSYGMPVLLYDAKSAGARAYLALADEILHKAGAAEPATVSATGQPI